MSGKLPAIGSTVEIRGSVHKYIVEGYITTLPLDTLGSDITDISVRCGQTIRIVPLEDLKGVL